MKRSGLNAATRGSSSATVIRMTLSLFSLKRSTASATSLYLASMNSPVCRRSSPMVSSDPWMESVGDPRAMPCCVWSKSV